MTRPKYSPAGTDSPYRNDLSGTLTHVVTGASAGIGAAIAALLAGTGRPVVAVGRNPEALESARTAFPDQIEPHITDLADDTGLDGLADSLQDRPVGALIHCAGAHHQGTMTETGVEVLDELYRINVRAPYRLTQRLVPSLAACQGDVVFINSSAGLHARANAAAYSATKFALRALTDALREEVNELGIRVQSVFPGRTATPCTERIFAQEERGYDPSKLLQPNDVAKAILSIITAPRHAEITDVHLRPREKSY